ncbi:MAG: MATE family efflux transporter [Clostridia bacterium]|nr:MATE family efflux transporter [Clostridia bacterium]
MADEKFVKMTTEPVEKLIMKLAIPTIISMLVTTFYNMADTYFVGKIGMGEVGAVQAVMQTRAQAAVGVVMSLMAVIQAFGFFFGHGSGNFVSRALGKHDVKSAERIASSGFWYAVITGGVLLVLGQIFAEPLAVLLGANKDFLDYTVQYMRIILIGAPITMASLVLNNQIRFQGNATYAMLGISAGAVLNVGLDALFILKWDMEVIGAALATVIGQIVSLILLLIGTERSDCIKIRLKNVRFNKSTVGEICRGGLPSLGRQGLNSVSTACLNNMAGIYGALAYPDIASAATSAVAAMTVVSRIMMFAASTLIGFGQGFQPVCGFNYGAGLYKRVTKSFWFCVKVAVVFIFVVAVPAYILSGDIVAIFRDNDPIALEIGTSAMRWQIITFPVMSWVVMGNMMLQTMGRVVSATVLSVSRNGLSFIPAVLILPLIFGLDGVLLAQPVADIIALIMAVPITVKVLKELSSGDKNENSAQNS